VLKRTELHLVADLVQAIRISDMDAPVLHCLREDVHLLDAAGDPPPPILLAPLDPLIYDRKVTSALWGFDYIWEVYTPPHKRVRGYYALPVLSGDAIVGHVDPKADHKTRKLHVISRSVRRGHSVAPAVKSLAKFLGLK
ncbi:MAG: winged helix-turn-helix domain-containing protein, partial [Verrucomicrobiaceae bacterium]